MSFEDSMKMAASMPPKQRMDIYRMYQSQAEYMLETLKPLMQETLGEMYDSGDRELSDGSRISRVSTTRYSIDADALYNGHRDLYMQLADSGKLELPAREAKHLKNDYGLDDCVTEKTTTTYRITAGGKKE